MPEAVDVFWHRAVFAYPLSCDGGLKEKNVGTVGYGVSLVTIGAGIVGVEAVNGVQAWIEEDDDAFAEWVIGLLPDSGLARHATEAALSLVEGQHNSGPVVAGMEALYQRMVQT